MVNQITAQATCPDQMGDCFEFPLDFIANSSGCFFGSSEKCFGS